MNKQGSEYSAMDSSPAHYSAPPPGYASYAQPAYSAQPMYQQQDPAPHYSNPQFQPPAYEAATVVLKPDTAIAMPESYSDMMDRHVRMGYATFGV
jgi:hypothetical protein